MLRHLSSWRERTWTSLIEALDKAAETAAIENRRDLANHLRGCVVALLMQAEPKAPCQASS
jgi:hypothetical protein